MPIKEALRTSGVLIAHFWLIQLYQQPLWTCMQDGANVTAVSIFGGFQIASGGLRLNKIEKPSRFGKQLPKKGWRSRPLGS
ncbi:hypothetical protein [Noviherbaspirillum suwonense]|uniref:hypothetical protein n=1 Tax=Noviherbaspirillum suwonense TaxID=1224511 RepID=UPI0024B66561|nr:hypothetical protein [Noviherbaspirillum suwonense]